MKKIILIISLWAISFCFGFWVAKAMPADYATTTMTVIKTGEWWPNSTCASPPAVINYKVTERMSDVRIATNGLHWKIQPGNTFEGGWARLWAFWSDDGYRTWISSGWDYTTNDATFKVATGYGDGNDWVGQMISTICDQDHCPKDPKACNGRQRSNIIFVPNPDNRPADTNPLKILPEDVGVFHELGSQQFQAFKDGIDVSNNVDWYIEEYPFQGQPPGSIEISDEGLATIKATWGRVNIKACYPKGCKDPLPTPPPIPDNTGHLSAVDLLLSKDYLELAEFALLWLDEYYLETD